MEFMIDALAAGTEGVIVWADVLDRINVYPVPDGDTGRNLVLSLNPLRGTRTHRRAIRESLLMAARGNSGNIASRFFSGFLEADDPSSLPAAAMRGRDLAYLSVGSPQPGTMLTFFDVLADSLGTHPLSDETQWTGHVIPEIEAVVRNSNTQLLELRQAGVVDAGALGMFIFFHSFFHQLDGLPDPSVSVGDRFGDMLQPAGDSFTKEKKGFCVDAVIRPHVNDTASQGKLAALGDSTVTIRENDYIKVHLHTDNRDAIRENLGGLGRIVQWSTDDLGEQTRRFSRSRPGRGVHVMTDGAGTVTRDDAAELGFTLLDSYINLDNESLPETYMDPNTLFAAMRAGIPVSTSQASVLERRRIYEKVSSLHSRVVYLCVGSVYTGNHQVVSEWKSEHDPKDSLKVIDSGAASGRLGLVALMVARYAQEAGDPDDVFRYAAKAVRECREYIFLERLYYLARSGRMSRTGAFFGDMLKMKPIISPMPEGAKKAGVVRGMEDQTAFALDKLTRELPSGRPGVIMLQYTDNQTRIRETILPRIAHRFPESEILVRPLSLTSAVHMGPGTWGMAFMQHPNPDEDGLF